MSKNLTYTKEARQELLNGVEQLAKAVTVTLGPSGRNVLLEQQGNNPVSTKDGVTVAKNISLKDPIRNMGAQLVKQVASKTNDEAGDGTTTSTLLAYEFIKRGLSLIEEGTDVVQLKKGIESEVKRVVDMIEQNSIEISSEEQLQQIATISANNDETVGKLVASAMEKVGVDGVVTAEESRSGETYLDTVEGMQFERGYKSPYFVTDNDTMMAVLNDPFILILDKRVNQVKELLPVLEAISQSGKPLLLIAQDIEGEALSTLVVNKMRGILQCVAVKAPDFGDRRKVILEDIAILTGGASISEEKGMNLSNFQNEWLGKAKKVTVTKNHTTIIDALGDEQAIEDRIKSVKTQIDNTTVPFEREVLQDRLAKMIGGVAIIHVGGASEVEMKEKKDRVDDALHATKAALEEGVLPGGGVALAGISEILDSSKNPYGHQDFLKGEQLVRDVIVTPFVKILRNAGFDTGKIEEIYGKLFVEGVVRNNIGEISKKVKWQGFNPKTDKIVDMFEKGIIDPAKVTRLSLENAASVAGTLLTTEAVITFDEQEGSQSGQLPQNPLEGMM